MLAQEAQKQIYLIQHPSIQKLLLSYLNPEAQTLGTLFSKEKQKKFSGYWARTSKLRLLRQLPTDANLLHVALALMPNPLRDELIKTLLSLGVSETLRFLVNASLIFTQEEKNDPGLNQKNLSENGYLFTHFALWQILTKTNDLEAVSLIEQLSKQPLKQIYSHLKYVHPSDPFAENTLNLMGIPLAATVEYNLVTDLFKFDAISPAKAKALLSLLSRFENKELYTLLVVPDIDTLGYAHSESLFHCLFRNYPLEQIEQSLRLLNRFPHRDLERLLPAYITDHKTPLHEALRRNEEDLTRQLIQSLHVNPFFKVMLKRCCWREYDNAPMHIAAQYGNATALSYLLQSAKLSPHQISSLRLKAQAYNQQKIIDLLDAQPLWGAINSPKQNASEQDERLKKLTPGILQNPELLTTVNFNNETLLHKALKTKNSQNINFLLQHGFTNA